MKKKIYFADLTYDTGVLSCDLLPLGIGYVAAYTKALFESGCEIKIFKYINELLKAAEKNPPDIFAGSCFAWNKNLVLLVSKFIKERNPECLIVLGGLAFPLDIKRQKEFLLKNRHIDFFIPYDGEIGFTNLIKEYFNTDANIEKMKKLCSDGPVYLNTGNEIMIGKKTERPRNLDLFPSPYTTGLFDKFFESKKFTPMVQTTRGCPYTCAYCWASNEQNRRIGSFSLERVKTELNYIAEMATKNNIYDLCICDSNFGLYEKDRKIIDKICQLQQKYNYPRLFGAACEKQVDPQYIKNLSKVKGITYCLSTQSTDSRILENVNRKKVDLEKISNCVDAVHETKKYIATEIITGLPYETRQTHMSTIKNLMDCGFDFIDPFTFMLLDGIELDSEEAHKKFQYDIRYRLIPRNFGEVEGKYSFEIERVVVGTNTYDFEDYIYFRSFHGLLRMLVNNDIYKELLQYIKQHGVHLLDWFIFVFDDLRNNTSESSKRFDIYIEEAHSELWDSPEELMRHYSKAENYEKLLTREKGDNLMQKQNVLSSSIYFDIYADYFAEMAKRYLMQRDNQRNHRIEDEISDIKKFIVARLSGVITKDIQKTKTFSVNYDILKWIKDEFKEPLCSYRLVKPKVIVLELSDEQVQLIKSIFKRYKVDEKNPYSLYRTTPMVRVNNYFRKIGNYGKETKKALEIKNGS